MVTQYIMFTAFYLLVFELHQMCFQWQRSDFHDPKINKNTYLFTLDLHYSMMSDLNMKQGQ